MEVTVQSLCNALARSKLVQPEEVRNLYYRWNEEAKNTAADPAKFSNWLVAHKVVTAYQIAVLNRGRGEQLFLSQYTLLDKIGRGRMAGVFKAAHRLGQTVAIKVLPPSKVKDPQSFGRFQREARLAVKLKHPNIVRTFQTGETKGLYYLVMEYLEGETLAEVLLRRGRLPPTEAVRLVHQAMLGLEHIHEKGLVHRDLNPTNLMLVGGEPNSTLNATVKILDIGMGRAMFDEGANEGGGYELTAAGDILGNPDYMSPEQARDAHKADIRADVYSLGCVLYHTLGGQPPFPDKNRVRQLMRITNEAPKPITQLNPEVPDGLQQILNWMLAKDPAQRYPTPERAAQALQVFLSSGATVQRLENEPEMVTYLEWLDTEGGEHLVATPEEEAEADVELVLELIQLGGSEEIPTPAPKKPAKATPPKVEERESAPAPRKPAKPSGSKPAPASSREEDSEEEDPPSKSAKRRKARKADSDEGDEEGAGSGSGSNKGLIIAGIGLLGLLLIVVIVLVILLVTRR
jgi:eukaryotic-like serine/threonine-protein kinase